MRNLRGIVYRMAPVLLGLSLAGALLVSCTLPRECASLRIETAFGTVDQVQYMEWSHSLLARSGTCHQAGVLFKPFRLANAFACPERNGETWRRLEAQLNVRCVNTFALNSNCDKYIKGNAMRGFMLTKKSQLTEGSPVQVSPQKLSAKPSGYVRFLNGLEDVSAWFVPLRRGVGYVVSGELASVNPADIVVFESLESFATRHAEGIHRFMDLDIANATGHREIVGRDVVRVYFLGPNLAVAFVTSRDIDRRPECQRRRHCEHDEVETEESSIDDDQQYLLRSD